MADGTLHTDAIPRHHVSRPHSFTLRFSHKDRLDPPPPPPPPPLIPYSGKIWRALNLAISAKTLYFLIWRILNLAISILNTNDVTAMTYAYASAYARIDRVRPVSYQLTMETFEVEGCVRGHHIYHTVWSPTVRERQLDCAVAVMRSSAIVGHVPHTLVNGL